MFKHMSTAANRSITGPIATTIRNKVATAPALQPVASFEIFNDSYKHAGHHAMQDADNRIESHFRLEIVSDAFKGLTLPKRHRMVFALLEEEFAAGLHSVSMTTRTVDEARKKAGLE